MITGSWTRFRNEMYLGKMLCEAQRDTRALGFRGHHKNGGFKGFVESKGIPIRRAYRLIERYQKVLGIVMVPFISDLDESSNDVESAVTNAAIKESVEAACNLPGIHDGDPVTNEKDAQVTP